jgi:hypothetical protein
VFAGSNSTAQPHFVGFGSGDGSLTVTASYGDWIRLVPTVGEPLVLTVGDLGLASDPNLRDVGGYRTTDGRWVWMGVVYRSQGARPQPGRPRHCGQPGDNRRLQPAHHLIGLGRSRLGYALPEEHPTQFRVQERMRGVAAACAGRGLAEPVALEVAMDGAQAALAVDQWTNASVTAVCAYNDETAMAVLAGMHRRGLRAPDDITVIGVGDIAAARVSIPPLTTIGLDYGETGRELAQAILESLAGGEPAPQDSLSRPRLVRRASA